MSSVVKKSRPLFLSTLVVIDLETTGLPTSSFSPEITELCMLAYSRFTIEDNTSHPRVENQLKLCFNPTRTISSIASKISGLNADNLFYQKDFDSSAVDLIQLFIKRLDPPISLIAHNGLKFDFPLLRAQIGSVKGPKYKLNDCNDCPINCTDTLIMFREFADQLSGPPQINSSLDDSGYDSSLSSILNKNKNSDHQTSITEAPLFHSTPSKKNSNKTTQMSFSLSEVYKRVFGRNHDNAHYAEGDCRAMLQLIQYLGSPAIDWLQCHYVNFNEILPMYTLKNNEVGCSAFGSLFPYQRKPPSTTNANIKDKFDDSSNNEKNLEIDLDNLSL